MAETNATILIPDISGFTEFMTTTELSHSSHAINILIDSILKAVGEEYEVSEIEGDAVLLIKKGPPPSKKEIQDICLKIFNAFHFQRKWMQQYTICPCGACQAIINLTLKFIAHHGPLAEITIGRFVKHSGTEMIVAHRLLKNSINANEYLLMTEKLAQQAADTPEFAEMEWNSSSEEYASIGKIPYRFALLHDKRKNVPEPPVPPGYYNTDNTSYVEIPVNTDFREAQMILIDMPGRTQWLPGLQKVEQDFPTAFTGSVHSFTFDSYNAIISPLRMTLTEEGVMYAESWRIEEMTLSFIYEFVFKKIAEDKCNLAVRFLNSGEFPVTDDANAILFKTMQQLTESLAAHCEKVSEGL